MTEDQFDIAMVLMNPSLRGSPDYDPEADYPSLSDQMDAYYDYLDDLRKEERANESL